MCLLGLALNTGPHRTTALIHLRDEKLDRPTAPPAPAAQLVCGVDLQRSGTWFGWHRGRCLVAGLTNVRARLAHAPATASRGLLVLGALDGSLPALDFEALLQAAGGAVDLGDLYAPFNLLLLRLGAGPGAPAQALLVSNVEEAGADAAAAGAPACSAWVPGPHPGGRAARVTALQDGVHVVANVPGVNDTRWGKVAWIRSGLEGALLGGGGSGDGDGGAPAAQLVGRLAAPFLRAEPLDPCQTDFGFSPHTPAVEAALQSHVLIPWGHPIPAYGSRSLMMVAAPLGGAPFFAWQELQGATGPSATATPQAAATFSYIA